MNTNLDISNILFTTLKSLNMAVAPSIAPYGSYKLLHEPNSDVRLTKSGNVFFANVKIGTPLAKEILKVPESICHSSNDGSISSIIFMSELATQLETYLKEGEHPRKLFSELSDALISFQKISKTKFTNLQTNNVINEDLLKKFVSSLLHSKLNYEVADHLTNITTQAITTLFKKTQSSTHKLRKFNYGRLIEIFERKSSSVFSTRFIDGLVLDHGPRHPLSPSSFSNCYILNTNVKLELERTEVNSLFVYKDAKTKEEMAAAERELVNKRIQKIIQIKEKIKKIKENEAIDFLVINYGGIDPTSLEMLYKEGISALRRCKRRNMERIGRICGGYVLLNLESYDIDKEDVTTLLGWCNKVTVERIKDEIYTYLEEVRENTGSTLLLSAPTQSKIRLLREATEQAILSSFVALESGVVKGAGNFEMEMFLEMEKKDMKSGYCAFRNALLSIPKAIAMTKYKGASNKVEEFLNSEDKIVELDERSKDVWDGFSVKRDIVGVGTTAVMKFLLIDKIVLPKGQQ